MTPHQYRLKTESFCKLRSTKGLNNDLDINDQIWNQRQILKVVAYDRTNSLLIVENENGFQWKTDLKKMEFCWEDGRKVNY
ncbi:hypothetical protein [Myroides odoratus]|uniref:hypothetical protein n=1 Tax=Myroides odoratus TaxID=256 RepID=UPI0007660B11|nr:hypothetical protein [Myroides odoratus]